MINQGESSLNDFINTYILTNLDPTHPQMPLIEPLKAYMQPFFSHFSTANKLAPPMLTLHSPKLGHAWRDLSKLN